jgi:hypothetical protein
VTPPEVIFVASKELPPQQKSDGVSGVIINELKTVTIVSAVVIAEHPVAVLVTRTLYPPLTIAK